MANRHKELKKRILEEMTVDYSNALEKNFNLAMQFIRTTKEGKIDVIIKDKITVEDQILIYLIGKLYAKEAELSETYEVENQELMDELGIPGNTIRPKLKKLRDNNKIKPVNKGKHIIQINVLERTLKSIEEKLKTK